MQTVSANRVILNVYDLHEMNDQLYSFGLGLYHSGVQIGGLEWTFAGGAGIFSDDPKGAPAKYRESVDLGEFRGTSRDVDSILDDLRQKFKSNSYNILSQNCNSFAEDFCQRLLSRSIPGYVNRMAYFGSMIQCILPPSLTNAEDPVSNSTSRSGGVGGEYRQSQIPRSFSGAGAKLGGATEMSPMPTASSAGVTNEQKERARKARLDAFAS
jgi:hypothetical protein